MSNLNCLPPRPDSERADSEMTYLRDRWLCSMLGSSVVNLNCLPPRPDSERADSEMTFYGQMVL